MVTTDSFRHGCFYRLERKEHNTHPQRANTSLDGWSVTSTYLFTQHLPVPSATRVTSSMSLLLSADSG